MSDRALLGAVVRLQVQRQRLKATGRYDPGPILRVDEAAIGPLGMMGLHQGGWVADVHGPAHPAFRGSGRRAVSVGFTGHYAAMARRFGDLVPGVAGENVLVDADGRVALDDVAGGIVIETGHGDLELRSITVAAPCVEFTSFLLGHDHVAPEADLAEPLALLGGGMRGYVASVGHLESFFAVRGGDLVFALARNG